MDPGPGDGGRAKAGRQAGDVWAGFRLEDLEAVAKNVISLRLCLEPHLEPENISMPPIW